METKENYVLRCKEYHPLKKIDIDSNEIKNNLTDIGRPLTVVYHDAYHKSLLSDRNKSIELKGLVNLLVLLLITYNLKKAIKSFQMEGFVMT